jgi:MFS family permease
LAVLGIFIASFVATIDATIVATSLQTITGELGRPEQGPLIVLSYLLATTASTPFWGRFGDVRGRKFTMQILIALFSLSSLAVAAAQSMTQLVGARLLQGLAGGGVITMFRSLIGDIATPRERGRYQWMASGVWIAATALGPLVGGYFVDHASWRWSFAINLPIGALAMAVLHYGVPKSVPNADRSLDLGGTLLLGASMTALSAALLVWGGEAGDWGGQVIAACVAATVVFFVGFVMWERREPEPLVPSRHLRNRNVVTSNLITFSSAVFTYQVVVFAPIFVQVVKLDGATKSGLIIMPLIAGNFVSSFVSGRFITNTGRYREVVIFGSAMACAGTFLLSRIDAASGRTSLSIAIAVMGFGNGMVSPTMFLVNQNSVPQRDLGTASSINTLFRSVGNVIGVGLVGAVFANTITSRLRDAGLAELDPERLRARPTDIAALPADQRSIVINAFDDGLSAGFRLLVIFGIIGLVLALVLKAEPLRDSMD